MISGAFGKLELPETLESCNHAFLFCSPKELIVPENCPAINSLTSLILFYNPTSLRLTIKMKGGTCRRTAMTGRLSPLDSGSQKDFETLLATGRLYDEK